MICKYLLKYNDENYMCKLYNVKSKDLDMLCNHCAKRYYNPFSVLCDDYE